MFSKHKVSQGYSPADENAGSFTPFEMTVSKGTRMKHRKLKLSHYLTSGSGSVSRCTGAMLSFAKHPARSGYCRKEFLSHRRSLHWCGAV